MTDRFYRIGEYRCIGDREAMPNIFFYPRRPKMYSPLSSRQPTPAAPNGALHERNALPHMMISHAGLWMKNSSLQGKNCSAHFFRNPTLRIFVHAGSSKSGCVLNWPRPGRISEYSSMWQTLITPPLFRTLNAHGHMIVSCKSRRLTFLENDGPDAAAVPGPGEPRPQR